MPSPISLGRDERVAFDRPFHFEILRGGMNRLLLRSFPTASHPKRVEIFFQYVQHLDIPLAFDSLAIQDVTSDRILLARYESLPEFKGCRLFRFEVGGQVCGHVLAAGCSYDEDDGPAGAPSMFFMM
jgi:hypothetical protein